MSDANKEITEICVVCLEINKTFQTINTIITGKTINEFPVTIRNMLNDFMELESLNQNNHFPQNICMDCLEDLKVSYSFRQKCLKSEIILKNFQEFEEDKTNFEESVSFTVLLENILEKPTEKPKTIYNEICEVKSLSTLIPSADQGKSIITAFICRKCEKCFLSYTELNVHNSTHSKINELACHFCNKEFLHTRHIAPHINREHSNDLQYICGYCDHIYKTIPEIENHLKEHQPTNTIDDIKTDDEFDVIKQHICDICKLCFKSKSLLKRHIITHNPDKPFRCEYSRCKWSFATEEDLLTHATVNHSDNSKNECVFCEKTFKEPRLLRQHMISHKSTKRFVCTYCPKGFNLLHHMKNHEHTHTRELQFLCSKCGKTFVTKDRLAMHLKTHSDDKPYKCDQCDKAYRIAARLREHQKEHNDDRSFMCSVCGLTFTMQYQLTKHISNVHSEEGKNKINFCALCELHFDSEQDLNVHIKTHTYQYQCEICLKSFSLRSTLESHIKVHSKNRAHKCTICNAAFNRPEHLKSHNMRKHTGVKPFKCEICEKTFYQSGELNIHMRRHTGERPYKCDFCPKSFVLSNALRFHTRTHTGEKPYKCAVCNKGHATMGGLTSHMKTHNRKAAKMLKNQDSASFSVIDDLKLFESIDDDNA